MIIFNISMQNSPTVKSINNITIGEEEDLSKYDFASIALPWQLTPDEEGKLREVEAEEEGGGKLATLR